MNKRKSRLLSFHPFLSSDGLLRVGGKIHHFSYPFERAIPQSFLATFANASRWSTAVTVHIERKVLDHIRNLCRKVYRTCVVCFRISLSIQTWMELLRQNDLLTYKGVFNQTAKRNRLTSAKVRKVTFLPTYSLAKKVTVEVLLYGTKAAGSLPV